MTVALVEPTAAPQPAAAPHGRPSIIDCDFHNEIDSLRDLYPYLSRRWRDHLETFGLRHPNSGYYPRFMDNREEARPPSGRKAGSEVGLWGRTTSTRTTSPTRS